MARTAASPPKKVKEPSSDEEMTSCKEKSEENSDEDSKYTGVDSEDLDEDWDEDGDDLSETPVAAARAMQDWIESQSAANEAFSRALRHELAINTSAEAQWTLIEEMISKLHFLSKEHRTMVNKLVRFMKATPSYQRSTVRLDRNKKRKEKNETLIKVLWEKVEQVWGSNVVEFLKRIALNVDYAAACKAMCLKDPSFPNWTIRINRQVYKRSSGSQIRSFRVGWCATDVQSAAKAFEEPVPLTPEQLQEIGAEINEHGVIMPQDLAPSIPKKPTTQESPQEESSRATQRSEPGNPTEENATTEIATENAPQENSTEENEAQLMAEIQSHQALFDYVNSMGIDIEEFIFTEDPLSGDFWDRFRQPYQ